jgi:hypothetical protein
MAWVFYTSGLLGLASTDDVMTRLDLTYLWFSLGSILFVVVFSLSIIKALGLYFWSRKEKDREEGDTYTDSLREEGKTGRGGIYSILVSLMGGHS